MMAVAAVFADHPRAIHGKTKPETLDTDHARGDDQSEHGNSHISVVDSYGNAPSMTTSVDLALGSVPMIDGFMLNNQLTGFEATPRDNDGQFKTSRVEGGNGRGHPYTPRSCIT